MLVFFASKCVDADGDDVIISNDRDVEIFIEQKINTVFVVKMDAIQQDEHDENIQQCQFHKKFRFEDAYVADIYNEPMLNKLKKAFPNAIFHQISSNNGCMKTNFNCYAGTIL